MEAAFREGMKMLYEDYSGACDGLIKTGYHFCKSMTEDTEWKLKMTEKQRKNIIVSFKSFGKCFT